MLYQIPEWIGTAVIGAVLAALAFIGKSLVEMYKAYKDTQRLRRSKLIELQSLLKATHVAFRIQNDHARTLTGRIVSNYSEISGKFIGYEDKISGMYNYMNDEEKELHAIIRGITVSALFPTNKAILAWLRSDSYFKASKSKKGLYADLAQMLLTLDSHIILWIAKYEAWIPDHPERALVYLADEKKHGLGFPSGIDDVVNEILTRY